MRTREKAEYSLKGSFVARPEEQEEANDLGSAVGADKHTQNGYCIFQSLPLAVELCRLRLSLDESKYLLYLELLLLRTPSNVIAGPVLALAIIYLLLVRRSLSAELSQLRSSRCLSANHDIDMDAASLSPTDQLLLWEGY